MKIFISKISVAVRAADEDDDETEPATLPTTRCHGSARKRRRRAAGCESEKLVRLRCASGGARASGEM